MLKKPRKCLMKKTTVHRAPLSFSVSSSLGEEMPGKGLMNAGVTLC